MASAISRRFDERVLDRRGALVAPDWDEFADGWDEDPAVRVYSEAAYGSLCDLLDRQNVSLVGASVCDFGCGTGLLTERLVEMCESIDAIDNSPAMIAVLDAKIARHGWTSVRTMFEPKVSPLQYDLVVCSSVCGFLPDYPGTVAELVSALRPGGIFVQWDWEADPASDAPDGLSRESIRAALSSAGLRDISVEVGFRAEFDDMVMAPLMGTGRM